MKLGLTIRERINFANGYNPMQEKKLFERAIRQKCISFIVARKGKIEWNGPEVTRHFPLLAKGTVAQM